MKKRFRPIRLYKLETLHLIMKESVEAITGIDPELTELWKELLAEAIDSNDWNVREDYNGCTLVQDDTQPSVCCLAHDYMWITGRGGVLSDRIYYNLMISVGFNKGRAKRRWFAVRTGWYTYFMWKYIFSRNWKKPTEVMTKIDRYFKSKRLT